MRGRCRKIVPGVKKGAQEPKERVQKCPEILRLPVSPGLMRGGARNRYIIPRSKLKKESKERSWKCSESTENVCRYCVRSITHFV